LTETTNKIKWDARKLGAAPKIGSVAEKRRLMKLLQAIAKNRDCNKLRELYSHKMTQLEFDSCVAGETTPDGKPYPWQWQFHNAGAQYKQRAVIANNQSGKTRSCGAELACHVTGWYPEWWEGSRFDRPTKWTVGSNTNETLRDPIQLELYGGFEAESRNPDGMGWIPKSTIANVSFRQCGLAGVFDEVQVRHVSGGVSSIKHKTYEQGWTKWQGTQSDGYWLDEEPENDDKIFSEVLRGLLARDGMLLFSRTPLFGMTQIIKHFMQESKTSTYYKNVTLDDSPHISEKKKAEFLADIPDHEVECRSKGIPMLGEGAIYPIGDDQLKIEPFQIPKHWRRIVGLDFGHTDHPTAAVWIAHNPDPDITYIYDVYKKGGKTMSPAVHAAAINKRGFWIPVAWPHDGMQGDRTGSGKNMAENYKALHVNMLHESARYDDDKGGSQAREPIIQQCFERMVSGRLRVFSHLAQWFEEKRMYHRKDGKVVAVNDDLMSATHYGHVSLRYARPEYRTKTQDMAIDVDPLQEFHTHPNKRQEYSYAG